MAYPAWQVSEDWTQVGIDLVDQSLGGATMDKSLYLMEANNTYADSFVQHPSLPSMNMAQSLDGLSGWSSGGSRSSMRRWRSLKLYFLKTILG